MALVNTKISPILSEGSNITLTQSGQVITIASTGGGGGGITGSGTSGYVTFWNGSSTVTGEANLFWDATNDRLGIGTSSPAVKLDVVGNTTTLNTAQFGTIGIQSYAVNNAWFGDNVYFDGTVFRRRSTGYAGLFYYQGNEGQFRFASSGSGGSAIAEGSNGYGKVIVKINLDGTVAFGDNLANNTGNYTGAKFLLFGATGNISINSTTDLGYKLDVNGTVLVRDNLTILNGKNIILETTTGTKIGTSTSQKIGFFNATPVVQPSAVTSAQGIADALTSLGLLASSTISGGGSTYSISTKTTTYNETATSGEIILLGDTTTAGFTITLPSAVSNTAKITIKKIAGTNNLTIDGNGSETIDGGLTAILVRVYESITLVSDNSNWHII